MIKYKKKYPEQTNIGRPKLELDESKIEALAKIHCTLEEIAAVMGCSMDTLGKRFSEVIKKGKEHGKASLRRMQFESATKGNVTMMIWLGKQLLGQRDIQDLKIDLPAMPEFAEYTDDELTEFIKLNKHWQN